MALFSRKKPVRPAAPPAAPSTPAPADAPLLLSGEALEIEQRTQAFGRQMLDAARRHKSGLMTALSEGLMDWAMKDEGFKLQLFRFIDAYPTLTTPEQIHEHLVDYLTQPGVKAPKTVQAGLKAGGMAKGLMTSTMSKQITSMASKFIAGSDAKTALPTLKKLWNSGVSFTVDLLGEACVSEREADAYLEKYLDLVRELPGEINTWPEQAHLVRDHLGPIPRVNISVKISSLSARFDPIDAEGTIERLMKRLLTLLQTAKEKGVFINFDMEQFAFKDLTLDLFERCCDEVDFEAGIVLQAYLRSGEDDARRVIEWAKRRQRLVTVRLVKGAYWDYETILSEQAGSAVPVWSVKSDTDANFERLTDLLLSACPRSDEEAKQGGIKLALGSHNLRSIAHAAAALEKYGLPKEALESQMLHGMADQIKTGVGEMGFRIREYFPVGEMIPGMSYFVRRLLENTSNESWLRAGFADNVSVEQLFARPQRPAHQQTDPGVDLIQNGPERHALSPAFDEIGDGRPFFNERKRGFGRPETRQSFARTIAAVDVPSVSTTATTEDANRALDAAAAAFPGWRDVDPMERAKMLINVTQTLREKRDALCGIMIKETGHTWLEADGEVCEAIDYCAYYARHAASLFGERRLGKFIGELNNVVYEPRGVTVVVGPWNHPLSIMCSMVAAAFVTGNTLIVCPADQAAGVGKALVDVFVESGAPKDAVQFLAGGGASVHAHLSRDPRVATVAYAGFLEEALHIRQAAGQIQAQDQQVKEIVCDLGGKNAVIVDTSADLDDGVKAICGAAFGYQGQKYSSCSRAIVLRSRYEQFLERLSGSMTTLRIGDPMLAATDIGPVIDEANYLRILEYLEVGKQEARLHLALDLPDELPAGKHYIAPHLFAEVKPEHRIAREVIFGPVLAVIPVDTFEEALAVANSSPYKLTGGVFSRKPSHLEKAKREFRVGNLYINRSITGSAVGRQPFGGLGLSGVGATTGGEDYLRSFVQPRTICENTMRRGFAPEL